MQESQSNYKQKRTLIKYYPFPTAEKTSVPGEKPLGGRGEGDNQGHSAGEVLSWKGNTVLQAPSFPF